ncbi:MAG: GUN4 domain-containing protein [Nostoc sp. LLA-1]|nr:GUN4 domain-containing protein [Cyanocohniella sp. LLY]
MNIRFKQILSQLFRLINRRSLIEKLLYSSLLVVTIQAILEWTSQLFKAFTNWIDEFFKYITDYIYLNSQTIIFTIIGLFLLGVGCFLYFKQWQKKQSQIDENSNNEAYSLEENAANEPQTIYTEGNFNENIYGDFVEIHGNQININNDFAEVAEQIRELVEQLKNQGYSQKDAEEEIANELEEKALNNPKLKRTIRRWRKSFSSKNNAASDNEIAQEVVKTATSYSYTSSKDFTDVIGGNFHTLNELLQSKKWEEADWETAKIIYAIGQNELSHNPEYKDYLPDYIVEEHIKIIPKKYLNNIDKLWNKHSNGRFGFNVQKRILENIYKQNPGHFYFIEDQVIEQFGDLVGWRKKDDWLYYVDLYDSLKTAAPGHLPLAYMLHSDKLEKCEVDFDIFIVIFERL